MAEPYLRLANINDMDLLFRWANDDAVRQNAFITEKISYADHKKWFNEKQNSENCVIYICYIDNSPVGQARVEIENGRGLVSYSIDAEYRMRGYGGRLLEILETIIKSELPQVMILTAKVRKHNITSQRRFEKLNYILKEKDTCFIYEKEIKR